MPAAVLAATLDAAAVVLALGRLDLSHRQARLHLRRRHPCRRRRPHRVATNSASRSSASAPTAANSRREVREAAKRYGVEPLITDDYLEVEAKVAELQPELVLGTQMERHIAKRLGIPCAVISAPVHVQDFPARYSPQMGFEGANVIFDTWVHPLMMGLEEHLLAMFRDDFEFHDGAAPSHLGAAARASLRMSAQAAPRRSCRTWCPTSPSIWAADAEKELAEDSVLRSRQGAPQHRALRPGTRRRHHHRRDPVRCQSAFRPLTRRPIRVVIVTMDSHLAGAAARAQATLAAANFPACRSSCTPRPNGATDDAALDRCSADIARGDIVIATMLFMEDHIRAVLPALPARREHCDAMVCCMSAGEVVKLTRIGKLRHERRRRCGADRAAEAAARQRKGATPPAAQGR